MNTTKNKIQNTTLRKTNLNEFHLTENLTREAFWNLYKPGCDEHLALHQLREGESYIPDLDLVALLDGQIVGHVITTGAMVITAGSSVVTSGARVKTAGSGVQTESAGVDLVSRNNSPYEVLCLGPVSAHPDLQGRGIGSQLIRQSIASATAQGFKAIILYGDPAYYSRFGFENAQKYGISTRENKNFDPFMALELYPDALDGISGRFFEDDRFFIPKSIFWSLKSTFRRKRRGSHGSLCQSLIQMISIFIPNSGKADFTLTVGLKTLSE